MRGNAADIFLLIIAVAVLLAGCAGDRSALERSDEEARAPRVLSDFHPPGPPDDFTAMVNPDQVSVKLSWSEKLQGDYNGDSYAIGSDLFPLAARFQQESNYNGHTETTPGNDCIDGNKDGVLDGKDLFVIATNFQATIDGYNFYRSENETGPWTLLNAEPLPRPSVFEGCQPTYEEDILNQPAGSWYYALRVWDDTSGTEGAMSNAVLLTLEPVLPPDPPANLNAGDGESPDWIDVDWDPSPGAESYSLHRAEDEAGPYAEIYSGAGNDYRDEDPTLEPGTDYWYKANATNTNGTSDFSDPDAGSLYYDNPVPEGEFIVYALTGEGVKYRIVNTGATMDKALDLGDGPDPDATGFALSADNRRLLYISSGSVYLAELDDWGDVTSISNPTTKQVMGGHVSINDDGTWIAFGVKSGTTGQIWTRNLTSGEEYPVGEFMTVEGPVITSLHLSGDGTKVLYSGGEVATLGKRMYVVDSLGEDEPLFLNMGTDGRLNGPGTYAAIEVTSAGDDDGIWVHETIEDGQSWHVLEDSWDSGGRSPSISDDGTVVFGHTGIAETGGVWVCGIDGSDWHHIYQFPGGHRPRPLVSNDGQWVAFYSYDFPTHDVELAVMGIDGENVVSLTSGDQTKSMRFATQGH